MMTTKTERKGIYIALLSLHGLIRGHSPELGRDADTGGQIKYVLELARALSLRKDVWRVDLMTRQIFDHRVSGDYAQPIEKIAEKAFIVRIPFGPKRYLRKESLWNWIEVFLDAAPAHFRSVGRTPDVVHGHYADAGLAGARLANVLGVPFAFTGHSLGWEKKRRLLENGLDEEQIESRYNIARRIEAEEKALAAAALVVASTKQEADIQYASYGNYDSRRVSVIPPGTDLQRFRPPKRGDPTPQVYFRIGKFLKEPRKPWILALSRADPRKNLPALIQAFGENQKLQEKANLVIAVGHRDRIEDMDREKRQSMTQMLLDIDHYDLYGRIAYPKQQIPEDVPAYYRLAASTGGVFVNPALTEPFGLTLLEAAASGLPVVATNDGGPRDILAACKNGLLIDPLDPAAMAEALLDAIGDPERWKKWAGNGVRLSHRHFSWDRHAANYMKAIKSLVNKPASHRVSTRRSRLPVADRILITDIDNTLIGDKEGLQKLIERMNGAGTSLAFGIATGRRLESARQALKEWKVPKVDLFITAVGTQIHYGDQMAEDTGWRQHISYRWDRDLVRETLKELPGLLLQPESEQLPHKVSFYMDPKIAPPVPELAGILRPKGVLANVIFSHGQFLDILPIRASKGDAVRYLAFKWGIPMERVLVAGDSGNDAEMLSGNALGVAVGNYSQELEKYRDMPRLYFAEGHYALGILEGIDHYDFLGEIKVPEVDETDDRKVKKRS